MTGKWIVLGHEIERGVEFFLRHLPSDECTVGELGGEQGLADAADHTCLDHCSNALNDGGKRHPRFLSDEVEGLALETGDEIF